MTDKHSVHIDTDHTLVDIEAVGIVPVGIVPVDIAVEGMAADMWAQVAVRFAHIADIDLTAYTPSRPLRPRRVDCHNRCRNVCQQDSDNHNAHNLSVPLVLHVDPAHNWYKKHLCWQPVCDKPDMCARQGRSRRSRQTHNAYRRLRQASLHHDNADKRKQPLWSEAVQEFHRRDKISYQKHHDHKKYRSPFSTASSLLRTEILSQDTLCFFNISLLI